MDIKHIEISVIMPVFNEQELIENTVSDLIDVIAHLSFEIILVDDGSHDDTWNRICSLSKNKDNVKGLKFTRNFGHQSALAAGIEMAKGDAVITMDSDGEHPVKVVVELVEQWKNGAKVVQAIRSDSKSISKTKKSTSRGFYKLFSWLADTEIKPGSADFRLLDRGIVDLICAHPNASGFLRGFVPWTGYETTYVNYDQGERLTGQSKFTTKRMMGLARQGILGFSIKPLRMSLVLGLITCFFALCYLVYIIVVRLTCFKQVADGWASIAALLALLGGVQLLVIGILGEYVGVIFETLRNQPRFIINDTCGYKKIKKEEEN